MGMDYSYAGSASYPRFEEELTAVVHILGGELSSSAKANLESDEQQTFVGYFMGALNAGRKDTPDDFVFPENSPVPEIVQKFVNHPYHMYTHEETSEIWNYISKFPEIEEVMHQLWYELETIVQNGEGIRLG